MASTLPPNTNEIEQFMHCGLCLKDRPNGISPRDYSQTETGFTKFGIQIWCKRHECNIAHIDFQNKSPFPANVDISKAQAEEVAST